MINGHGDDRKSYAKPIRADFSSNVWVGGTDPELIVHLQQNMHLIGNYPEPDATTFCQQVAAHHRVESNQVLAFNGSVEAFYTIALTFRASVSAILYPAFAEYEDACRIHSHHLQFFLKSDWQKAMDTNPSMIWIGNPNNPDGGIFQFQELKGAVEKHPNTIFIIDEAYAGFYPEFQSSIELTKSFENLIVVRSLTKCCAIPGLRLGYVVASAALANRIKQYQQPWSVNALAQEAGVFLLNAKNGLNLQLITQLSVDLQHEINRIEGFKVILSKAPFFLIEMHHGNASQLKQFLLDEHGILIRDASNFRGLNEQFFRVCTKNENDNQLLFAGLKSYSINFNQSNHRAKSH